MKQLYEIPRHSRIGVKHLKLRFAENATIIEELDFHHLDGMYSYCKTDCGSVINLASWTEVEYLGEIE